MGGIISGFFEGAGNAGVKVGLQMHEAAIQEERDARLHDAQKELANIREEGADRRLEKTEAGAEKRLGISEAGAEKRLGISEAGAERRQEKQIASNEKIAEAHNKLQRISIGIQAGHLKLAQNQAEIQNALNMIQLKNVEDLKNLQAAYRQTDDKDEKARIRDQIHVLNGKDAESYIPVPTGYDETTGKPTGYAIFDKNRGVFMNPNAGGGGAGAPTASDIATLKANPSARDLFDKKFGAGAADKVLGGPKAPAAEPEKPGIVGRQVYNPQAAEKKMTEEFRDDQKSKAALTTLNKEVQQRFDQEVGSAHSKETVKALWDQYRNKTDALTTQQVTKLKNLRDQYNVR